MFIVDSLGLAIVFCVITMLGWGSWANTQKLAGQDKWEFPLFYWDYALGVALLSVVFLFTAGSMGSAGMPALENLGQAAPVPVLHALLSGAIFNLANILLVVAISSAGMSVAFPVGVGLALVIGTVTSYVQLPKGNAGLLFGGVLLVVAAMVFSAMAYSRLPRPKGQGWRRGIVFAAVAGCLMGFFYPELSRAISPGFQTGRIEAGYLTPYTALLFFAVGLLVSNLAINTIFLKSAGLNYSRLLSRLRAAALAGRGGRDDLDAGPQPEHRGIRRGRAGNLVRPRAGSDAGGGDLGRAHLERVSGRSARNRGTDRIHVRGVRRRIAAHWRGYTIRGENAYCHLDDFALGGCGGNDGG